MKKALAAIAATPSFIGKVLAALPGVLAEAVKLQNAALDTTIASTAVAIGVAVWPGALHITAPEVAGWLALTGTVAAAVQKVVADLKAAK